MEEKPKRFSDFAIGHLPLDGEKLKMEEILGKEIEVLAVRVAPSKFAGKGDCLCLTIQFILGGKKFVVFTGSGILAEQAKCYQAEVPFLTTIKRIDRYYSFT